MVHVTSTFSAHASMTSSSSRSASYRSLRMMGTRGSSWLWWSFTRHSIPPRRYFWVFLSLWQNWWWKESSASYGRRPWRHHPQPSSKHVQSDTKETATDGLTRRKWRLYFLICSRMFSSKSSSLRISGPMALTSSRSASARISLSAESIAPCSFFCCQEGANSKTSNFITNTLKTCPSC